MRLEVHEHPRGEFDRLTAEAFEAKALAALEQLVARFREGGALEKGHAPFPRDGGVDALGELSGMLASAYRERIDLMSRAAVEAVRASGAIAKGGGPYIGPRGGKWADPEHTIPWKEGVDAGNAKKPESFDVHTHPAIFGAEQKGTYRVVKREDGKVRLSRHEGSDYGPEMPEESVKHFVNDLAGKVDLPKHGNAAIDAVVTGQAEFLGKGDDGLAFRVGDQVVKVSTTVPYQPENPGHRTPDAAAEMLRKQVETGNRLADMGVPGIQRSEFIRHGDKGFQIKPWVKIPETLTRSQLDAVQQMVHAMHAKGYALNDEPQVGIDPSSGDLVMFDVGKAAPDRAKKGESPMFSDKAADMDRVAGLYRKHGQQFVNLREPAGEKAMRRVEERLADWTSKGAFGMARRHIEMASKEREKEIRASVDEGPSRNAELQILEWRTEDLVAQVDAAEQKAGKSAIAKGAHRVPSSSHPVTLGPPPTRARKRFPHQGTIDFQGLRILVENRAGSYRTGTDSDGHRWRVKMLAHYGEIAGTEGTDGDRLDAYVGPNADSPLVVVVHQQDPQTKAFDEDKVMLGFDTVEAALALYRAQYDRPGFYGGHEAMPIGRLLRWAKDPENRGQRVRKGGGFGAYLRALAGGRP